MKVTIALLLVGIRIAFAQPAGQKPMTADDVTDCSYWDKRILDVKDCIKQNKLNAQQTRADASMSGLYGRAVKLCEEALPKYYAQKAKCEARQQQQMGATAMQGTLQQQLQQLNQLLGQVNSLGQQLTAQNISMINQALKQIVNNPAYQGAGMQLKGDPLANLGADFDDVSEQLLSRGRWDDGPWFGEAYPTVTPVIQNTMTTQQYCQAWLDAGTATCDKKVDYYFGRTTRATLPFQYEFSCDPGAARTLCKDDAAKLYDDCIANDGVSMYPRSTRKRCRHRPEHWLSLPSCTCLDTH